MRALTPMPRSLAWRLTPVAGLLVAATLGCAAAPDKAASSWPQPHPAGSLAAGPPEQAPPVRAAIDDAARRTGLAAVELKVASVERVTWLDGSLGCPELDLMYTQALVLGYRIRIEAGGKTLDYHTDTRGEMLLCPLGRAVAPAVQHGSRRDGTVDATTASHGRFGMTAAYSPTPSLAVRARAAPDGSLPQRRIQLRAEPDLVLTTESSMP